MKKVLCLIVCLVCLFTFVCCGEEEKEVINPSIDLKVSSYELNVGETKNIDFSILNNQENTEIVYEVINKEIAEVNNSGVIKGLKDGTTKIRISIKDIENSGVEINVTVKKVIILINNIKINDLSKTLLAVGDKVEISCVVAPSDATDASVSWEVSNDMVLKLTLDENDNYKVTVEGAKTGKAKVIVTANDSSKATSEIEIEVAKDKAPVISVDTSVTSQNLTINYNQEFDPLEGVTALDDFDGDVTKNIVCTGEVNNHIMGTYTLTYNVTDSKDHSAREFTREIEVIWDYPVTFIGHAGSYAGVMNTENAFLNAVKVYGYQAIECDLKQTKDGVFVLCHDDTFNGVNIASTTYDTLLNEIATSTRGGNTYRSKICTLERYLQICKTYKVKAVIELKYSNGINNNDQSRMQALMDEITKCGMLNSVIFLASQYKCLEWTRNNGYAFVPCQYLVSSCESDTFLERCITNNFDISFSIDSTNTKQWIDKYHAAGLKVAAYTFSQYKTAADLQTWMNLGLDFVTCDQIKPYEVKLPETSK